MNEMSNPLFQLMGQDDRYQPEAYEFVRAALAYAHEVLELGQLPPEKFLRLRRLKAALGYCDGRASLHFSQASSPFSGQNRRL